MVVHDRSYARWEGDRERRVPGVWVIFERGVSAAITALFKRKMFAQLLTLVGFAPFLFAVGIMYATFYFKNTPEFAELARNLEEMSTMVSPTPDTVWGFLFVAQKWVSLALCVVIGAGLIAEDRRSNALELYLSRPLTVRQYVLGKFAVMAFFLSLISVVQVVLGIGVQMLLTGPDVDKQLGYLDLMWRGALAASLGVTLLSLLVLAASSLAQRARNAAILWIGFMIVVDGLLAGMLTEVFRAPNMQLVSIGFNVSQLMAWILQNPAELDPDVSVGMSAMVLGGWALLSLGVVLRRVRPVEIVA
jgi:ABC-2 type transport system permease protein